MSTKITFFATPADLRKWFERHGERETELWVGFHKRDSGKPSVTWPESVDEALCVGWIDGLRKSLDAASYKIRFSPRKPTSIWSAINIRRATVLLEQGRMRAAGRKAFDARRENKVGIYSYEQRRDRLEEPYASLLKKNKLASTFFDAQSPSYRKRCGWWVISAKTDDTRLRRLAKLIAACERGRRLDD